MIEVELLELSRRDQVRRGLRPGSIEARQSRLRLFMRHLGPTSILEVDTEAIETFLDGRRIGPRTRYAWVSHLHGFFSLCLRHELVTKDPTVDIVRPKLPRLLPRPAPSEALEVALAAGDAKHRAWIMLAAYEGLRCAEIAGLRVEDVVEVEGLLRITAGKGGRERMVPMHPDVVEALGALPLPRVGFVFLRPQGGPYPAWALSHEFNRFLAGCGLHVTAHQLRHWFATSLYGDTRDLRLTQEMLGHASVATTAIYTAFDRKGAAAAIARLHVS